MTQVKLNNERREASRHFRNKKKAYLKAKIEDLETNSKIKNIRDLYTGISDFKKGHQPRTNIVKDEKGNLVADFHSIVARWRNYFSQLLNVHGVNDIKHMNIQRLGEIVLPPSHNALGVCNQITLLIDYYISSRLVTLLEVTDAPIQIPNILDRTVSFNVLNFSFQIYLLFMPEMSASFTSFIVQIIYIALT